MTRIMTYQYIIKRLPDELVRYIHEYVNPETTYVEEQMKPLIDKYKIDAGCGLYTQEYEDFKGFNPTTLLKTGHITNIMIYMNLFKTLYTPIKKTKTTKNCLDGAHEKHFVESILDCFPEETEKHWQRYVHRGEMIIAFILSGFQYEISDIDNKTRYAHIYATRKRGFKWCGQVRENIEKQRSKEYIQKLKDEMKVIKMQRDAFKPTKTTKKTVAKPITHITVRVEFDEEAKRIFNEKYNIYF